MGPRRGHRDVCNGKGLVHELKNLFVADASLLPEITSGSTNVPTALMGWRTARNVKDFLEA